MLLAHRFGLATGDIETRTKRPLLRTPQWLPRQTEQLFGIFFLEGSARVVEGFEFVAGGSGILHSCQYRVDSSIVSSPEVVGD